MRVIAGKYKGRILKYPKSKDIRPLQDRAKEALFNILDVEDKNFLDIYAGSGQIGIEALSMGAKSVVFVDKDSIAVRTIKENIKNLEIEAGYKVLKSLAEQFVNTNEQTFDIIVANPPFAKINPKAIEQLFYSLNDGGILVLIHDKSAPVIATIKEHLADKRQYGDTYLTFYEKD